MSEPDDRMIKRRTAEGWAECAWEEVETGDVVQMFEPDGKMVELAGCRYMRVDSEYLPGTQGCKVTPIR